MTAVAARDLWMQWADSHAAEFAEQQWLLSKYEVSADIAWPRQKVALLTDMLWQRLGLVPGGVSLSCAVAADGWWATSSNGERRDGDRFCRQHDPDRPAVLAAGRFMVADASACPLSEGCADAVLCYAR